MGGRRDGHDGTLVLGAAVGLHRAHILPFLLSLQSCGFSGETVLYVDLLEDEARETLKRFGVRLLTLPEDSPLRGAWVNNSRYFIYELFLARAQQPYRHVLLTDVRDVLFQRNPFLIDTGNMLGCFLEAAAIGDCSTNSGWIRAAFGEDALARMQDKPIVCSGTTLGPAPCIRDYLSRMTAHLRGLDLDNRGIDQGVHNYLVHVEGIEDLRLFTNGSGPVLTMGHMPGLFHVRADGLVCREDGEVAHVLHQYDRFPELRARCLARLEEISGVRLAAPA